MKPDLYYNFRWGFDGESQVMLVENGRVAFREPARLFEPHEDYKHHDLGGKYLLPGFIDPHCHLLPAGLDSLKLQLGKCSTREQVLDHVSKRHSDLDEGEWLMAVHYDQTKFPDGKHLTRFDLDAISNTRPILLRHANGHASIANTAALTKAAIGLDEPNPRNGKFDRNEGGELTGVLLEGAHEAVWDSAPKPTLEEMVKAILSVGETLSGWGIACASDLMTGRFDLEREMNAYRIAAERGCKIRTRLYLQWGKVFGPRAIPRVQLEELEVALPKERCCVSGVKIFADGAIASGTAAIYGRFLTSAEGEEPYTDGQLIYPAERLKQMVSIAHEAGYRIAVHSIGDRSTDLVLDAYSELDDAARHRIEHAMILSDSQIERMHRLGVHCCMQPEFLTTFSHAYLRQLGPGRTSSLNRYKSVLESSVPLSFSSDLPITTGNPWRGIDAAVNRPDSFSAAENLTRAEALFAYTAMGAAANGETDSMGWLSPGHLADFQLLDADPLME